jgi:hypothetical protein
MEAIITKYHGPKASGAGATISASVKGGERLSIPYPYDLKTGYNSHKRAARLLADKLGWRGEIVGGDIKGGYAWVFVK